MDNRTADTFVTNQPDSDRLKLLIEVASGEYFWEISRPWPF
jgi:hypothetical protein